jgi:hypothetical protein
MSGTRSVRTAVCRLDEALGRPHPCTTAACPFWQPGGAVLEGRCVLEHVDFERRPELAPELLDARRRLERARTEDEARDAHELVLRVLGESAGD